MQHISGALRPDPPVQYDGDLVDCAVTLRCSVEPGALLVRVPSSS